MLKVPYWKLLMCLGVILAAFLFSASSFVTPGSKIANFLPSKRVNLGLDLRGGAYLLLEMQLDSYDRELAEKYLHQIRVSARAQKVALREAKLLPDNTMIFETEDPSQLD